MVLKLSLENWKKGKYAVVRDDGRRVEATKFQRKIGRTGYSEKLAMDHTLKPGVHKERISNLTYEVTVDKGFLYKPKKSTQKKQISAYTIYNNQRVYARSRLARPGEIPSRDQAQAATLTLFARLGKMFTGQYNADAGENIVKKRKKPVTYQTIFYEDA